jgi:hypothetical protein
LSIPGGGEDGGDDVPDDEPEAAVLELAVDDPLPLFSGVPHAAMRALAAPAVKPSRASLRTASRLDNNPST